jgi:hypothetical protein
MNLDRDELLIKSAFSQVKVDSKKFEKKVVEDMKLAREIIKPTPRKKASVFLIAAIFTILVGGLTAFAAGLGVFERFRTEVDPSYIDFVNPVEISATDEGIRVEIIAAQQFGEFGIIYLSAQDITGQNRFTESAHVWLKAQNIFEDISINRSTVVHIDEDTNTVYFECQFQSLIEDPGDTIRFPLDTIIFEQGGIEYDFPIPLTEITSAPTIPNNHTRQHSVFNENLIPSGGENFPELPEQRGMHAKTHWISNVGISDGQLRIQFGISGGDAHNSTSFDAIYLNDPDGNAVWLSDVVWFSTDENFQVIQRPSMDDVTVVDGVVVPDANFGNRMAEYERQIEEGLHFMEAVFPIDVNALESYTLTMRHFFTEGIIGDWEMDIHTGDTAEHLRVFNGAFPVGDFIVESVVISPLGVRFTASNADGVTRGGIFADTVNGDIIRRTPLGNRMSVETTAGNIELWLQSAQYSELGVESFFITEDFSAIDIRIVTAVIIDGVRIPF